MLNRRQNEILAYLARVNFASNEQIAAELGVSVETIRRNLMRMEKEAPIERVRGGATYNNPRAQEVEYAQRLKTLTKEKTAIAELALDFIENGEAIAIGNGAISLALARCLSHSREELTVITNSPEIGAVLNKNKSNTVYLAPGYLRKHNGSLTGSMCVDFLKLFRVDKAIISVDGLSIENGITEYNTEEAAVLRQMLRIGGKKIVLCEFTKFKEVGLNKICDIDDVDDVFTDWNCTYYDLRKWSNHSVRIHIAPQNKAPRQGGVDDAQLM